jgi:hypothetical protein
MRPDWKPISQAPKNGASIIAVAGMCQPQVVQWVEVSDCDGRTHGRWCVDPELFMDDAHFEAHFWGTSYEPDYFINMLAGPHD